MIRVGSLFSGIGGFELGLQMAGWPIEVAWQVEIDPWCRKVLAKHWPPPETKRYEDIRECGRHNLTPVDIIVGGFPCQDISLAGRGAGLAGERSGLWWEMHRIIGELRPRLVIVENVTALLGRGMGDVLGSLAASGYDAEWDCVPACAVGAPHTRDRVFIVAYPDGIGWRRAGKRHEQVDGVGGGLQAWETAPRGRWRDVERWARTVMETGHGPIPACGSRGMDNGLPHRVDRLRGLGNAVVPQVVAWIARRIDWKGLA